MGRKKEQKAVLKMLAEGKITVEEAHLLLDTLAQSDRQIEYEIHFPASTEPSDALGEIQLTLN